MRLFFVRRDLEYKISKWEFDTSRALIPDGQRPCGGIEMSILLPLSFNRRCCSLHKIKLTIGIMYTNLVVTKTPVADLMEVAMKVGDILRQKTARIATVRMNETVGIAAQLMRASNISALVVKDVVRTEGNTAAGMFTERDVVRAIAEHGAAGVSLKVSQLISVQQLVSCCSTDTLEQVRHLMNKNHIRHLPVIDNYTLIGVVSLRDISKAFDDEANAVARSVPA